MKILIWIAAAALNLAFAQAAEVGQNAPDFSLAGSDGKTHKLSDYRGKPVVLEWFNNGCPFVKKHYQGGHMQALQKRLREQGVVWLTVISSAKGEQGHVDRAGAVALQEQNKSQQNAILLDPEGTVGKAYGAQTTPHMYLVSKEGKLAYQGAIDNRPSTDTSDIDGSRNYIVEAVDATLKGQVVKVAKTPPYGCSVKYN